MARSNRKTSFSHFVVASASIWAGLYISTQSGCVKTSDSKQQSTPQTLPSDRFPTTNTIVTRSLPILLQPDSRPVVQGGLPLVYLVESAGQIRVTDVLAGRDLGVFAVRGGQIVRVSTTGVVIGTTRVVDGPLAGDNQSGVFAITVVPPIPNPTVTQERINTPVTQEPNTVEIK